MGNSEARVHVDGLVEFARGLVELEFIIQLAAPVEVLLGGEHCHRHSDHHDHRQDAYHSSAS